MNDADAVGGAIFLLAIFAMMGIVGYVISRDVKQNELNLKKAQSAYETQLKTYVNCMQKTTDKTLCGAMPNVTDYFNLTLK